MTTSDRLYPNLYTCLVAPPGVGKTRTIMKGRAFLSELDGLHLSPTDVTTASLIDALLSSHRRFTLPNQDVDEFHSMNVLIDEWGTMLKTYDSDIIPILTSFYDVVVPFSQWRRGKETRIKIDRPQLNILAGSTASTIMRFVPDWAWDQGFTSRMIMVYSDKKKKGREVFGQETDLPPDLRQDIQTMFYIHGECKIDQSFADATNEWIDQDEEPKPTHPKLRHYNARRRAHIYKLSIICAMDASNRLVLNRHHFNTARKWLEEIEITMPDVFTAGGLSLDARVMDEIEEFVRRQGKPVSEHRILRFASDKLPAYTIVNVLKIMVASKRLVCVSDKPVLYEAATD